MRCLLTIVILALSGAAHCEVVQYRYDGLGRLVAAFKRDGPAAGVSSKTNYDAADNRTARSVENLIWRLNAGQSRYSADGRFQLLMQTDGNLVLYQTGVAALWGSPTIGTGSYAQFQSDGNLVVYNASNVPVWASGTGGNFGASLVIQNDGNMVISSETGVPLWATDTCCH